MDRDWYQDKKELFMRLSTSILGAAGEHFVMGELLRRGLIAARAPEGVPNFDIVITDLEGERLAAIQVKTRRDFKGGDKGWHMKAKHEQLAKDRMFYVFVDVGREECSEISYYVLPAKKVASVCKLSHENWRETPNKKGEKHGETEMRRLLPKYELPKYLKKSGYVPSQRYINFLKNHGDGWLESYRDAWHLLLKN